MSGGFSATSSSAATLNTTRDYTAYSAYLNDQGFLLFEGEGSQNSVASIEVEVPQTDTRQNPNELPDALGKHYAGGDFSHGSGQLTLHKASSDPAKYLYSEGFDISKPGVITHLNEMALNAMGALTAGSSGRSCQAQGMVFVVDGTNVKVFDPIDGAATSRNPHAGEGAVAVQDLTSEGDRVYAALGVNGIHYSDDAGATWSHHGDTPGGVGYIRCAWVKDRLCATSDRNFYEITAGGAAPTGKQPLRTGWTYTDIAETGEYVYASAIAANAGLSRIYHFGLDDALAFGVFGSSNLPDGDLCYSLKGYLGLVLMGCGRKNDEGGKDALLYKAVPSDTGFLPPDLVMDSEGAGALDLAVRAIGTHGRKFLVGWSLGDDADFGPREGMAIYDPAFDSFANHHFYDTVADPDPLLSILAYEGMHVWVSAKGVFYENMAMKVDTAYMIPSTGNWNSPQLKNWDQTQLSTKALPSTSSIDVQYTQTAPEEGQWSAAGTHDIPGATEATFSHPNLVSADFSLKLISYATASQADAPEIKTFSVRSNPTAEATPYRITATVRLADRDRLGETGEEIRQEPVEVKEFIEGLHLTWFDWYTADVPDGYHVRLKNFSIIEPMEPIFSTVTGNPYDEFYVVVMQMEGTRN